LFGVAGALLAIPVAASGQIAVLEWWRFRHGEPAPPAPLDAPGTLPPPAPAEG
jgi:predicted PurR-regulated permease PerM